MDRPSLTLPELDDDAIVGLHGFLYEVLHAFEANYSYQILRHEQNLRHGHLQHAFQRVKDGEDPF